jgi:hypothetical protein
MGQRHLLGRTGGVSGTFLPRVKVSTCRVNPRFREPFALGLLDSCPVLAWRACQVHGGRRFGDVFEWERVMLRADEETTAVEVITA